MERRTGIGDWRRAYAFGLNVYVFQKTGSRKHGVGELAGVSADVAACVPAGVLPTGMTGGLMIIGDGLSAFGLVYILVCMLKGEAAIYQICIGVFVSSAFSSLLEPSYRATVTDLLSKEEYSKASGMMSVAGSARYLISPIIAGLLLAISDIKLLLLIDICTFFLTAICTAIVRAGLKPKISENKMAFSESFPEGGAL